MALAGLIEQDIHFDCAGIAAVHRDAAGVDIFFLVNVSAEHITTSCTVRLVDTADAYALSGIARTGFARSGFFLGGLRPGAGLCLDAAPSSSPSLRGTSASRRPDWCPEERPVAAFSRRTMCGSSSSNCRGTGQLHDQEARPENSCNSIGPSVLPPRFAPC